jgi:hypothetical protein
MHVMNLNRRGFAKSISGGPAPMGVTPILYAFENSGKYPELVEQYQFEN